MACSFTSTYELPAVSALNLNRAVFVSWASHTQTELMDMPSFHMLAAVLIASDPPKQNKMSFP